MHTYTDKLFLHLDLSYPTSEFSDQQILGDFFSSDWKADIDYFPCLELEFIH